MYTIGCVNSWYLLRPRHSSSTRDTRIHTLRRLNSLNVYKSNPSLSRIFVPTILYNRYVPELPVTFTSSALNPPPSPILFLRQIRAARPNLMSNKSISTSVGIVASVTSAFVFTRFLFSFIARLSWQICLNCTRPISHSTSPKAYTRSASTAYSQFPTTAQFTPSFLIKSQLAHQSLRKFYERHFISRGRPENLTIRLQQTSQSLAFSF